MVHFVGAGSGAVDLITVRGKRLLEEADVIIYAAVSYTHLYRKAPSGASPKTFIRNRSRSAI